MKITYQIMPFKTNQKRKEIINKLLKQGNLNINLRDKNLLKYRGEKTVDPENSLESEFKNELNHPYFKGYKECVDFYLNPVDVAFGGPLYSEAIMEINWGPANNGYMGGAQLFIALNLNKYNRKNKKGIHELLKGTKDDVSLLSILDGADTEVLKKIAKLIKSGSKTKKKKKKTRRKNKSKKKESKKKTKQKKLKGGRPPKGNECMYVYKDSPGFPRKKRERTKKECVKKQGCKWGMKLSPHYPNRGKIPRCYKDSKLNY